MYQLMHEFRVRIMSAPAFTGAKVIAAILFERTMDGEAKGKSVPSLSVGGPGVVPIVKVDKGLEADKDGVQLMKPMPGLDTLLARAAKLGVFGTKMRSVINHASKDGIAAIARQQFEIGEQIAAHGLVPILEPEVSIKAPDKAAAEKILLDELDQAASTAVRRPAGDVQADHPRRSRPLCAADQGQAGACASWRSRAATRGTMRARSSPTTMA